jgi:hypothetical protein
MVSQYEASLHPLGSCELTMVAESKCLMLTTKSAVGHGPELIPSVSHCHYHPKIQLSAVLPSFQSLKWIFSKWFNPKFCMHSLSFPVTYPTHLASKILIS